MSCAGSCSPSAEQTEKYVRIRDQALQFARLLNELAPNNREKSMAITYLDAVVMNANAAIARGPEAPLARAATAA